MKCKLIFFLTLVLLPILAQAQTTQTLGTFGQGNVLELLQVCDNCTFVNLSTIQFPNSTILNVNTNMTRIVETYNYSFVSTEDLGTYIYTTCGDPDGTFTCSNTDFTITFNGTELSTAESIVYVIFIIALLFVFCLCLYGAITIPFKHPRNDEGRIIDVNDLRYVKVFLYVMSYLLLMFLFGVTRAILENYLFLNGASKVFNYLFWLMFYALWPLIVISFLLTLIYYLDSKKLKEALMRGVPMR